MAQSIPIRLRLLVIMQVYPLPGGNGSYKVTLLESVSVEDNLYAVSFTQDLDVQIADEFAPFLHAELLCEFHGRFQVCKKGREPCRKGLLF